MGESHRHHRVPIGLPVNKKQLQVKVKRLQREKRELKNSNALLRASLLESLRLAKELARMIPQPDYDYAGGCNTNHAV